MATNVEIKARVPSLGAVRARAVVLASGRSEVIQQTDTFFVAPRGRLKVREFADGSGELIAYERPDRQGPKESDYARTSCADARALVEVLARALPIRGTVSKRRELFLVGRTRIHLDDVRDLGTFVELEVVLDTGEPVERGQREAQDILRALEIPLSALVAEAYVDLLEAAASS